MEILEILEHFANIVRDGKFKIAIQVGCYNDIFLSLVEDIEDVSLFASNPDSNIADRVKEGLPQTIFYTDKSELFSTLNTKSEDAFIFFTEPWSSFKENVKHIKETNKHLLYAFLLPFGPFEEILPFKTERQVKRYLNLQLGTKNKFFTNVIEYSGDISYLIIQGEKYESVRKTRS